MKGWSALNKRIAAEVSESTVRQLVYAAALLQRGTAEQKFFGNALFTLLGLLPKCGKARTAQVVTIRQILLDRLSGWETCPLLEQIEEALSELWTVHS